jgi:hypothetical protein
MKISAQSLGSLAPYMVSAAIAIPMGATAIPASATAALGSETPPEALVIVEMGYHPAAQVETTDFRAYSWDVKRPELTPYSFVHIATEDAFGTYEPFIASEGWRDVSALEGPFRFEEEARPRAFFDEYDLSTIALYRRQQ